MIVPSITFLATATTVHQAGGRVVFADVDPETGLMTAATAAAAATRARQAGLRVAALAPVHLCGQTVDLPALAAVAGEYGAEMVEDACHAIGAVDEWDGKTAPVGGCRYSAMAVFSFHPVKTVAAGEGGAVLTNSTALARRLELLRNHGMEKDPSRLTLANMAFAADGAVNPWHYELHEAGYNYRLSDLHAALATSQLRKLPRFVARRAALRARYAAALAPLAPVVRLQPAVPRRQAAWHLAVALIDFAALGLARPALMADLRQRRIGSQVHYIPVHRQPFWRNRAGAPADLPGADAYFHSALSLPLFTSMTEADVDRVAAALAEIVQKG